MEIVIGIIIAFVFLIVLIVFGKIKGPPDPVSMSVKSLLWRMQSEGAWIQKYKSLPHESQQGTGIKKQYEDKKLYLMQLQLELMKRGTDKDQKSLIPVLQRAIELMRNGMAEEEAQAKAANEFVQKRDTNALQPSASTS